MADAYKPLAQARALTTNPTSVYSINAGEEAIIKSIIVANTSIVTVKVRIFHSFAGSTYDESTAIAWDVAIKPGHVWSWEPTITMNDENGNLAYRVDVASGATITIYGAVKT